MVTKSHRQAHRQHKYHERLFYKARKGVIDLVSFPYKLLNMREDKVHHFVKAFFKRVPGDFLETATQEEKELFAQMIERPLGFERYGLDELRRRNGEIHHTVVNSPKGFRLDQPGWLFAMQTEIPRLRRKGLSSSELDQLFFWARRGALSWGQIAVFQHLLPEFRRKHSFYRAVFSFLKEIYTPQPESHTLQVVRGQWQEELEDELFEGPAISGIHR
jgi:hypothetical protein